MQLVERLRQRLQAKQLTSRQKYGALLDKAARNAGALSERDQAEFEALVAELGLAPADVEAHLEAVGKFLEHGPIIARGREAAAVQRTIQGEIDAFNAQYAKLQSEWGARGQALAERFAKAQAAVSTGEWMTVRNEELQEQHPIAFGLPERTPPKPMTNEQAIQAQRDSLERSEAEALAAVVTENRPSRFSAANVALLERAESRGWIEKGIAKAAAKLVPKEGSASAPGPAHTA